MTNPVNSEGSEVPTDEVEGCGDEGYPSEDVHGDDLTDECDWDCVSTIDDIEPDLNDLAHYRDQLAPVVDEDTILNQINKNYHPSDDFGMFTGYMAHAAVALRALCLDEKDGYSDKKRDSLIWLSRNTKILKSFLFPCTLDGICYKQGYRGQKKPFLRPKQTEYHRGLFSELCREFAFDMFSMENLDAPDVEEAIKTITPVMTHSYLGFLQDEYMLDQNPVYPWQAYLLSHRLSIPLQEWAIAYFLSCAGIVENFVKKPPKELAADVSKSPAFSSSKRSPGSTFSREKQRRRQVKYFSYFSAMLDQFNNIDIAKAETQKHYIISQTLMDDAINYCARELFQRIAGPNNEIGVGKISKDKSENRTVKLINTTDHIMPSMELVRKQGRQPNKA